MYWRNMKKELTEKSFPEKSIPLTNCKTPVDIEMEVIAFYANPV